MIGSDVTGAGVAITSGTVGAPVGAPVVGLQMSMMVHLSLSPQNVEQHSSTVSNIVTPVIALPISLEHDLSAPPEPSITKNMRPSHGVGAGVAGEGVSSIAGVRGERVGSSVTSGTVGAPVGAPVVGLQMSMMVHLSLSPQNVEQHSSTVSNIVTPVIALPISLEHDLSAPPEPSIT